MKPILFSFGTFHLYSYGLSIAVGVLLSLFLMKHRALKEGFPAPDEVFDMAFAVLVWGFLGARFFYVIQNFSYYAAEPLKIFAIWEGGLIFYGGAIAAFLGLWLTGRKKKRPFWKTLDFLVPYGALTHAFGRLGCFLNGCCFGKACGLPWAVRFPGLSYAVHPAQLYEAFYDIVLFVFLIKRRKQTRFEGEIALLYFLLYGMGRYIIEFVREPGWMWMGLTSNQWLSVAIMVAAFIIFQFRQRKTV
ncbi:MAG: prolipoprotein diacylglyceryl transferase [Candidatus Omnitrophota bacterium]|jgi:phosphatidylglycerol:prolipoprotein diacylglycerol transferase